MDHLIIASAGGFALEVVAYAEDIVRAGKASFAIKGFLDDTKVKDARHAGYPVLGAIDMPVDPKALYIIGIGAPEVRKAVAGTLTAKGAQFATLIHPQSYVATSAKIGAGSIITPFAFVGPEAQIGNHCLLNVHSSAGHESCIGDYCVLAPYAGTHAQAVLGEEVFMGSNACITLRMKVGARAKIAAGAVVYNDVAPDMLALGNPARTKRHTDSDAST
jgi:sugar O-acyltransferase (sialic acid O-acetyltransferase NeuD family)